MKKNIKNLAFGLAVTLIFFISIELILWLSGVTPLYEKNDPYVGFSGYSPLFVERTTSEGESIYATADHKLNWFNYQQFPVKKAEGVTRIFCLGGSTTYGRPYNDKTSFAGWLREFLPTVAPDRKWEVINAGGISYASYRVTRLMDALTKYDPDIFIIYTGHNEFLEERTYKSLLDTPEFIRDITSLASRLRLYTILSDLLSANRDVLDKEVDAILDDSVGPDEYHRNDELRDAVLEHLQVSLNRMAVISEKEGTDLIFVTPASNIKDFSPFKSEPSPELDSTQINRVKFLKRTIEGLIDNKTFNQAAELAGQAVAIDPRDAELQFLKGKALYALGRMDDARNAFISARDEDIVPLRALTPIPGLVEEEAKKSGSGLVDFNAMINKKAPNGIPGKDLFLDHVHPTIEGYRMIALSIIEEMIERGTVNPSPDWNDETIADITDRVMNSIDEKTNAMLLTNLSRVLNWAGKKEEALRLIEKASDINEDQHTIFHKVGVLMSAGNYEEALPYARNAADMMPDIAAVRKTYGLILAEMGYNREALTEFKTAAKLNPALEGIYFHLGLANSHLGLKDIAESYYRKAVELEPDNADACNNLGILHAQRGDLEIALSLFQQAVKADPDHSNAIENLERAKNMLGK